MCKFPSPVNTLAEQQLASFAAFIPSENDYLTTSGPKPSKPDEPFGRGDLMHGCVDESNIRFYFSSGVGENGLAPNGPGSRPDRRLLTGAKLTSTYRRDTMKSLRNGAFAMPLQRGEVRGYDFDRMIVEFTMLNQGKVILCAISTAAMDDLEGRRDVRPDQRVDQFIRLREVIEERASRKFLEEQAQADRPVVLRSNDFIR